MAFWTRDSNGQPAGSGTGARTNGNGAGDDMLRAATAMWEGREAQSRLIDGGLACATEAAESLRQTALQA